MNQDGCGRCRRSGAIRHTVLLARTSGIDLLEAVLWAWGTRSYGIEPNASGEGGASVERAETLVLLSAENELWKGGVEK
jgi:hypothetical protein